MVPFMTRSSANAGHCVSTELGGWLVQPRPNSLSEPGGHLRFRRFDCTEDTLVRLAASLYYRISRSRPPAHTGSAVIAGGLLLYPGSRQSLYSRDRPKLPPVAEHD
jgi:hypothetical protein